MSDFFGVSAGDPATILGVLAGVVAIALVAGAVPTLRAVRTDPVDSLRAE